MIVITIIRRLPCEYCHNQQVLPYELDDGGGEGEPHQDVDRHQHHVDALVCGETFDGEFGGDRGGNGGQSYNDYFLRNKKQNRICKTKHSVR